VANEFSAARYWDDRHRSSSPLAAGGDKGLSDPENAEFYALRLGAVLRLIHRVHGAKRPLRMLDAGCGNGQLTGPLSGFGHAVLGVDASPAAIRLARELWPRAEFQEASLERLSLGRLFDVVLAVDVLFHIVDDTTWQAALSRLTAHCKSDGVVIISDTWLDRRFELGNYIVHRAKADYDRVLEPLGWLLGNIDPYGYTGNPNGFGVIQRAPE
jgi:SAM-dependent methyltransferase